MEEGSHVSAKRKKNVKGSKRRNSTYRNYDTEDVEKAFKEVFEKQMSIRSAAAKHGVPASTLRDRVQGKIKVSTTSSGPAPYMPKDDEKVFVRQMLKLKAVGYRYRQIDIACAAADYGHYYGKRDISEGPMSRGWIKKFVDRQKKKITYQEYHFRTKCPFPPVPLQTKYYEELENILLKHRLKDRPHLIYNMSETALTTNCDYTSEPEATILSCVNALGLKLPPFFIFKGMKPNAKLTKGGPDGLGAVMSESGCPNSRIMQHYLKDHFLKNLEADEEDEDTHVLLLYDGHKSRILFPVVKWALEHKIILFVIPPHCSFTVEPYKVANFNPMEICYKKERAAFTLKHPGKTFDKFSICKIASKAYEKVFTAPAIIASYHEAGIFPFKSKLVQKPDEDKFAEVPEFRKRRKKAENRKSQKVKKSRHSETDEEEEEEVETGEEEDDISDFLSDSDDVGVAGNVSGNTDQDHSYGASSSNLDQGVSVDVEAPVDHVAEEVCVQSGVTDRTHKDQVAVVSVTPCQPKLEVDAVLPPDFPVETVIEMGQVEMVESEASTVKIEPEDPSRDGLLQEKLEEISTCELSEVNSSESQETASQVPKTVLKHEYMLIKPRGSSGSLSQTGSTGQLIRIETVSDQDASGDRNDNMVIKVVEVSQELYDRMLSGEEIVVAQNNVQDDSPDL